MKIEPHWMFSFSIVCLPYNIYLQSQKPPIWSSFWILYVNEVVRSITARFPSLVARLKRDKTNVQAKGAFIMASLNGCLSILHNIMLSKDTALSSVSNDANFFLFTEEMYEGVLKVIPLVLVWKFRYANC